MALSRDMFAQFNAADGRLRDPAFQSATSMGTPTALPEVQDMRVVESPGYSDYATGLTNSVNQTDIGRNYQTSLAELEAFKRANPSPGSYSGFGADPQLKSQYDQIYGRYQAATSPYFNDLQQAETSSPFMGTSGIDKEAANRASAQAFQDAVRAANPGLNFADRNPYRLTMDQDIYDQAESYYRQYGTGLPQFQQPATQTRALDPQNKDPNSAASQLAAFSAASNSPTGSMLGSGGGAPVPPAVQPSLQNTPQMLGGFGQMPNLSQMLGGPQPSVPTAPTAPTSSGGSAFGQAGGAFPSTPGNYGGGASGGMALEGRYGIASGNSTPFPIQGNVSVVKLAQGGDVSDARRMLQNLVIPRFAEGGLTDEGEELAQRRLAFWQQKPWFIEQQGGEAALLDTIRQSLLEEGGGRYRKQGEAPVTAITDVDRGGTTTADRTTTTADRTTTPDPTLTDTFVKGPTPPSGDLSIVSQTPGGKTALDILRASVGLSTEQPSMDINRDQMVNTADALLALRQAAQVQPSLPPVTTTYVPPTAPPPSAPPPALTAGQGGLDPSTAIVGAIPQSERVTIPQLDTEFRASEPRTPTYDRFGRITGYTYSPAAKLTPATGTNVFNWTPPGITSRPRSLLNIGDVPGVTIDPVTGQMRLPLSASQQFARDRSTLDNQFRQLYARAAAGDKSLPAQAPASAAAAFRNFVMSGEDPMLQNKLRFRDIEQQKYDPTKADPSLRAQYGQSAFVSDLAAAFDPFLARNRAALTALAEQQAPKSYSEMYPDIAEAYAKLKPEDKAKFPTLRDYELYHFDTYGRKEGRTSPLLGMGALQSPYAATFFSKGGEASVEDFIKKQSGGDVSRETALPNTAEVPQLTSEGQLIDENAEMRSESQRMLNRLKTAQQESYRRGKLPPGIQRAVTDVMSEEKPPLIRGPVIQAGRDIVGGAVGATPTEPTNPSNLHRFMQAATGAALPEIPMARTAQAARVAAQEPRATMSAARQSLEALADIPVALAQPNQLGAQAGAVRLGGKESGNKPSSIFTPLPKADAPFVGRLDTFVAELPGPVRKDQFLGSLEGKFRNYEIGRAQEALRDLPSDAKLSPVDLLNRIKQRYDPAYYRTQVVEPQPNSFYYQMDNVYQGPAGDEFPLGVIHLIQADNPQNVSKGFGKKLEKMIDRTFGGSLSPEELTETRSDLLNIFGTLSSVDKRRLARSWTPYVRANQEAEGFEQTGHYLLYPTLNRDFTETIFKNSLSSPSTRDAALTQILQDTAEIAKNKYGIEGLEPHLPGLIQEHLGNRSGTEAYNAVRGLVSNRRRELSKKVHDSAKEFRSTLRDLEDKQVENYRGQHTTLGNENNPIAFSRFSEHTTDIPGLGTTKGIYVNELQSDRLDDIRTKGPYGGSAQKDLATRVIPLKEQQAQLLEQFIKLKSKGASYDQLSAASKQFNALDEKIAKATKRVMEGTYSLRESFPGMEESPQVIQQLMAKNVISAAINRGVNFVAFPGAESKQAQLYEKLPNNLRQVVKDLGPGFEFRPVTLKTPDGQELTHPAVVWGPEAANRIKQKGVPFKDGGEVNVSRETSTSKQQLDKLAQVSQRKKA